MTRRMRRCVFLGIWLACAGWMIGCNSTPGSNSSGDDEDVWLAPGADTTQEDVVSPSDGGDDPGVMDTDPDEEMDSGPLEEDTDDDPVDIGTDGGDEPDTTDSGDASQGEEVPCCGLGECEMLERSQCEMFGGTPKSGDSCEEVECQGPDDEQPCCIEGQCSMRTQQECLQEVGETMEASDCSSVTCPSTQPCCLENDFGNACMVMSQSQCDDASGTAKSGSGCTDVTCDGASMSACCIFGECFHTDQGTCSDAPQSTFHQGEECSDVSC